MAAKRYDSSEAQWRRGTPLLPVKAGDPGRGGADYRRYVNGVLWASGRAPTGTTCRSATYAIAARTRFSTNLALQGCEPTHTLIVADEQPVIEKAAIVLEMTEGERVGYVANIREADDIPIAIGETYVSAARLLGFTEVYKESYSMTKALAHFGIQDYKCEITLTAAPQLYASICIQAQPATIMSKYFARAGKRRTGPVGGLVSSAPPWSSSLRREHQWG